MCLLPVLLSACGGATVLTAKVCDAWPQIGISKDDKLTDGTANQIERSNVGREALGCEYQPPAKPKAADKAAPKTS